MIGKACRLVLVFVALVVLSCSDSSEQGTPSEATEPEPGVRSAGEKPPTKTAQIQIERITEGHPLWDACNDALRNGAELTYAMEHDSKTGEVRTVLGEHAAALVQFGEGLESFSNERDRVAFVSKVIEFAGRPDPKKLRIVFYRGSRPAYVWPPCKSADMWDGLVVGRGVFPGRGGERAKE